MFPRSFHLKKIELNFVRWWILIRETFKAGRLTEEQTYQWICLLNLTFMSSFILDTSHVKSLLYKVLHKASIESAASPALMSVTIISLLELISEVCSRRPIRRSFRTPPRSSPTSYNSENKYNSVYKLMVVTSPN